MLQMKYVDNESMFELNPNRKVRVQIIEDNLEVVIIEDLYIDPDKIINYLSQVPLPDKYIDPSPYPDYRLDIQYFIPMSFYDGISQDITSNTALHRKHSKTGTWQHPNRALVVNWFDSEHRGQNWINRDSERRVEGSTYRPHADPQIISGIAYLTPGGTSGTGFFRHKKSGLLFNSYSPDQEGYYLSRKGNHKAELDYQHRAYLQHINQRGREPELYTTGSDHEWEMIARVDGLYNSAVLFPSSVFHSALIEPNQENRLIQLITME